MFAKKVYDLCSKVPESRVTTYKIIAEKLGCGGYRAVGQALRRNPYAPQVPCHRVVLSSGRIGGFNGKMSGKEMQRKVKLLKMEGVEVRDGRIIDFEKVLFRF